MSATLGVTGKTGVSADILQWVLQGSLQTLGFEFLSFAWQGETQLDLQAGCAKLIGVEANKLQVLSNQHHMISKTWMDNKQAISLLSLSLLLKLLCTV